MTKNFPFFILCIVYCVYCLLRVLFIAHTLFVFCKPPPLILRHYAECRSIVESDKVALKIHFTNYSLLHTRCSPASPSLVSHLINLMPLHSLSSYNQSLGNSLSFFNYNGLICKVIINSAIFVAISRKIGVANSNAV